MKINNRRHETFGKNNHLSRQTGHRKAMLANMACLLIEHKVLIQLLQSKSFDQ